MVLSEVEVIGSIAYRNEFPATMALMKDDRVNAGDLVTSRVSLSDIVEQGFEELVANRDRHVKILVQPSGCCCWRSLSLLCGDVVEPGAAATELLRHNQPHYTCKGNQAKLDQRFATRDRRRVHRQLPGGQNVASYTIRARSESASIKPSATFASTSTRRNAVPPEPEATSILSVASPTRR